MLVYGHHTVGLNVPAFVRRFRQRLECLPVAPPHDTVIALLVDWGEAESAVADALLPECDDDLEELVRWRGVSDAIAEAVCASGDQDCGELAAALARARVNIAPLLDWQWPGEVRAKTAEGFAHFARLPRAIHRGGTAACRPDCSALRCSASGSGASAPSSPTSSRRRFDDCTLRRWPGRFARAAIRFSAGWR